jgi:hypothetical protein
MASAARSACRGIGLVVWLIGFAGPAAAQHPADELVRPPSTVSSGDVSLYEVMYGEPVFYSLDLLVGPGAVPVPPKRSIRTVGRLFVRPRPGGAPPLCELCLVDEIGCLALRNPVPEIRDAFEFDAPFRSGHEAEVTGAFADGGFTFWEFFSGPPRGGPPGGAGGVTLEQLVRRPQRYEGRTVVVRGQFRGRNLFRDLPPESALRSSDWVLRDGAFFVWVTARAPKGKGFRLDASRRSDCVHRLEVEGRPEVRDGLVYLRAGEVRILGRAADP